METGILLRTFCLLFSDGQTCKRVGIFYYICYRVKKSTGKNNMRSHYFRCVFLTCLLLVATVWGVGAANAVQYISGINGLSNNSINCIHEDSSHALWIGTWDGLNVYNGRDITTLRYCKDDVGSLSNNVIRQIIEQGNRLWVSTDNGINAVDRHTYSVNRYALTPEVKIPSREKSFILQKGPDGEIVCLVKGVDFFNYSPVEDKFFPLHTDLADKVKNYVVNDAGDIIMLMNNGGVKKADFRSFLADATDCLFQTIDASATQIYRSGEYTVLNKKDLVYVYDARMREKYVVRLPVGKMISQIILRKNLMYVSYIDGGCASYDLTRNVFAYIEEISRQISVFSIYAGSQNILWVGTDGQGLIQLHPYSSSFRTVFTPRAVRCFCEVEEGRILVGTKGSGIKMLSTATDEIDDYLSRADGLKSNSVYVMKKNRCGDIFVGSEGSGITIIRRDGAVEQLDIPRDYSFFKAVYSLEFTHDDTVLWVGTSGYGLFKMNLVRRNGTYGVTAVRQYVSSKDKVLTNDVIYTLCSDDNHRLWLGTRGGGVFYVDADDRIRALESLNPESVLTDGDVLCMFCDGGSKWIGTSYGLNQLDRDCLPVRFADEKWNDRSILGILKDDEGNLWLSTNKGLSHFEVSASRMVDYNFTDGLQNDQFSDGAFFKDSRGLLFFGGVRGLNYFNPKDMHRRMYNADVSLNRLKIYNNEQKISERIIDGVLKLKYDERQVSLNFIARDLINNKNCKYAYRLVNQSDTWMDMGTNPDVNFAQLHPGTYHLEVRCSNGDKVWSNSMYGLTIEVGYPWWLGRVALGGYLLAALLLFWVIRSVVRNRIKMSKQILIAQTEKRHEQKLYASKLNFFTNVAHEFFTPLTLIYTPTQHLLEQQDLSGETRKYLQVIANNAERMQQLIKELMAFNRSGAETPQLQPEYIDVNELIGSVADNYTDILNDNRIDFVVNIHGVEPFCSDRDTLEKIIFNLLSNAFKYTAPKGYIHVDVGQNAQNGRLLLVFRNSGSGLTDSQMTEIFNKYKVFDTMKQTDSVSNGIGLNLTKKLTEMLGGEISINSEPGKYVEFTVLIPPLDAGVPAVVDSDKEESVGQEEKSAESFKDRIVLVVEEEVSIRNLLKDILQEYTVISSEVGADALFLTESHHPDIIICDMGLRSIDGFALIDSIRSNSKISYIPIICISSNASVEAQIKAFDHGADAFITQPFHPRQIITAIENLLSRQNLLKDYFNSSISSVRVRNGVILHPEDEKLIEEVASFILANIEDESLSPSTVADFVGVSKATLYRKFKELTRKTPSEFIRTLRLEHASKLLRTTKLTVLETMYRSGFSNKSYFYREFQKQYGVSPRNYRNQQ